MQNQNRITLIKPQEFPFFYGYVVLFIGSIGILASIPGQTIGVSVFTDPVKDALGLSRNEFSNAYMVGTLLSSALVARAGRWFDAYGARYVAFFATLLLGVSLLVFSVSVEISGAIKAFFNFDSWSVPFLLITFLFFLIRFSGQGVLTMASRNMIMMWFKKNRGKINSISSITVSLGFSSAPILLNKLNDDYGWASSWQIMAMSLFIFCICILLLYRNRPEDFNLLPDGHDRKEVDQKPEELEIDLTLSEAKKTRAFWMFALVLAFNSFYVTGFTFHIVSIFGSQDYTKVEAIAIFLPMSIVAICVSTTCNILSDYIQHKIYLFIMLLSGVVASLGLLFLASPIGVYLLVGGLGTMGGLFAVINAVTWPSFFGRKYLGSITGKVMSFLVIASAVAPSLFSYCYTSFGSYKYISYITLTFLLFLIVGSIGVKKPQ
ncbi:nitrate/nitrite transporter [Arenibacter sp. ARW7G5Y1]|uniref:MFS transporter n=1 Tax=Arenibacter sp. ARW7G5Y1 TaxID=2135619 RepID=UPI000D760998|nr:MFS transporter [Arenibacter sp. ARW7G5Y1]PXX29676.1 MFS transporter [Arenibacter sp. ARW7G5Y1]